MAKKPTKQRKSKDFPDKKDHEGPKSGGSTSPNLGKKDTHHPDSSASGSLTRPLSAKQQAFVREYLIDMNATAAYKRAGYKGEGKTAENNASRMLGNAGVQKAIQEALTARAARTELKADDVLRRWQQIADADPNELIEVRRACCRHCHGKDFGLQRTQGEMKAARDGWERLTRDAAANNQVPPPPFDEQGGAGYDARKAPHPSCPECFGEGVMTAFPRDTRLLSEGARRLYAGVKITKDGIEIKMRDQDAALLNYAKHLGMLVNKHEHQGPNGGAIPLQIIGVEIVTPPETPAPAPPAKDSPDVAL